MKIRTLWVVVIVLIGAVSLGLFLVVQPLVWPVESKPPQVSAARLENHVKHLSVDLHPRSQDQLKNINLAADYIFNELKASGGSMAVQDVTVEGVVYKNIIARFGPSSGPVMVVGAHYDSHGDAESAAKRGERFTADTHTPGADDNASGVAGMALLYPDKGNFIALVGRMGDFNAMRRTKALMAGATDLPVRSVNAPPVVPGIDFSDHLNYWEHGFRAVMVTDTAFMRNQNYHLAGDTYDKLNYQRMAKVVQGAYAVVQGY